MGLSMTNSKPGIFLLLNTLLLLLSLHAPQSVAREEPASNEEKILTIQADSKKLTTAGALYFIEDPLIQWSLPYLLNNNIPFQLYPKAVFNEGFTASGFWLKFTVQSQPGYGHEWLMEIDYPLLDVIDIFVLDEHQNPIHHEKMGDTLPFNSRRILHRNFILPLYFQTHHKQTVYLQVHSSSSLQVPVRLWEVNHFTSERSNEQYGLGLYYGMMLVMFLYNLFLWTSIRDADYLHYIAYIAAFSWIQLATSGLGYQFLWPGSSWFQQISIPFTIGLVGVFGSTFTRRFLQTKLHHKYADMALKLCVTLSLAICVTSFIFDIPTVMSVGKFVGVIFLSSVFYASFAMLLKGHRQARYFLAAWVALIIGGMITIGMMLGLLPNNIWTVHASKIGSALEITLLSFALADRIKMLQKEKIQAETRMKKELEARAERLAESNRLKNDFLATISHEFRTPLNGIIGSLELATEEKGRNLMNNLQDARDSARDMLDLVDNVLTYTELQAGNRILSPETVDCRTLLLTATDHTHQYCARNRISFELQLADDIPDYVRADIKCLRHALKALLDNAEKFTAEGSVTVKAGMGQIHDKTCLSIEIIDSGIGMTESELARIQQYFGQADSSMERQYQGLGIGLSLVRAVCYAMQGDVTIESEKYKGTRVCLSIPVQPVQQSTSGKVTAIAAHSLTPIEYIQARALIVEDNNVNQRVLRAMLRRLNIECDVADNGEKALALLNGERSYHYDLIFMDCQMPVMNGFEATAIIRTSAVAESKVPIIAVTANALSGDEKRCHQAGMNDYLSKPVSIEALRTVLARWLPQKDGDTLTAEAPTAASDQPPE